MISEDSVIIVLSHANNEWRKHLLKECLKSLKGEVILSTNYPVDFETQKICDWVVYSKKNEILPKEDFSKYNVLFNFWHYDKDNNYHETPFEFEHGYAVYTLIRNGVKFAKELGKTKIHIINYDYILSEDVFSKNDEDLNSHDLVCYRYENEEHNLKSESSYCISIMSGRIEPFMKYSDTFKSISDYYLTKNTVNLTLEVKTYSLLNSFSINILEKPLKLIKGLSDRDYIFSNNSQTNRFKEIGLKYGCDKVSRHKYHELYPNIFDKFKNEDINLFEIGVDEGKSLKVWKEFYPNCCVFGLDIQSEIFNEDVKIFKGDQSNINDLSNIINQIPKCDIIIDDGSHIAEHQLTTFYYLFENLLKDGGTYVIEDIECSYWKPSEQIYGYETGHLNLIEYFTKLNHMVNSDYNLIDNPLKIKKITYSSNSITIEKK
jgi:hypothetical protein